MTQGRGDKPQPFDFGETMRGFAQYIMRGRLQAMLVAVAMAILSLVLPPMNYLSSAVIALVALRRGGREGLIIIIGAGVVMTAFTLVTPLNPIYAAVFAAAVWLPVWLLALVLRATVSLPITVMVAGAIGLAGVALTYQVLDDPAQTWQDAMGRVMEQASTIESNKTEADKAAPGPLSEMLEEAAPHMTGMVVAALVLGLMLSLLLARWWQALLYNPGGFRREFHALRLSRSFAVVAVVVVVASLLTTDRLQEMALNMLIVVVAVCLLPGLALIHGMVAAKSAHTAWLAGIYVLLLILPQLALVLAMAALVDSWLDIRGRLQKKGPTTGNGV